MTITTKRKPGPVAEFFNSLIWMWNAAFLETIAEMKFLYFLYIKFNCLLGASIERIVTVPRTLPQRALQQSTSWLAWHHP